MPNSISSPANEVSAELVSLETGIAMIEAGEADEAIRIDFGNGSVGTAVEPDGLEGLLQRARGLRLIMVMAEQKPVERPAHMRKNKSALHPAVEEILDALKPAG